MKNCRFLFNFMSSFSKKIVYGGETRGIEYMVMDLERGLSTKEWPYVYHMKAS
jgi:hypothetical protein